MLTRYLITVSEHTTLFSGGGLMQPQVAREAIDITSSTSGTKSVGRVRRLSSRGWSYTITSWLGLVPFLLFCLLFELLPAIIIIQGSFTDNTTGALTLDNYHRMLSQAS